MAGRPGSHCRGRPACGAASPLPGPARLGCPAVLLGLVAVLIAGDPARIDRRKTWLRAVTGVVIAFLTLANLLAAGRLVAEILTNNKVFAAHPGGLLAAGGEVWATNVIAFALWYWDLDRGGAASRAPPGPRPRGARQLRHQAHLDGPGAARAPPGREYGCGGCTRPDRHRRARRQPAGRCSLPALGSRGAAPGPGPACPPPRSGRGAAGPPRCGRAARRVGRSVQVVRTAADDPAQPVRGDHLVRPVSRRGPGRLPRSGRPGQRDQRGIGKRHNGIHVPSLPPAASDGRCRQGVVGLRSG